MPDDPSSVPDAGGRDEPPAAEESPALDQRDRDDAEADDLADSDGDLDAGDSSDPAEPTDAYGPAAPPEAEAVSGEPPEDGTGATPGVPSPDASDREASDVPEDVRKYDRFKKMDGARYERVNQFLRDRTYVTAREWAIARLCSDFRTETGVEMTKIGEHLPELVPFMTDEYTPQAVNQARASFKEKVNKAGATFLYGAMSDFFTAEELDDVMYEATEVAKFLLEVEGADLTVEEELEAEDRISSVMREVRRASADLRSEDVADARECPNCGHEFHD